MSSIHAKVIADSIGDRAPRLTTMEVMMPRCILAEFNTHRAFSRNAASSRAIPVARMIRMVEENPFTPMRWTKNQPGMQGYDKLTPHEEREAVALWEDALGQALIVARQLNAIGAHKQIINRLLEPWMFTKVVVTATQWSNFFALRCHPEAEPHMQHLARAMRDAMDASTPRRLIQGDWHLPFVSYDDFFRTEHDHPGNTEKAIKLSVARCASVSYKTVEGFDMTLDRAIALHDKLIGNVPMHASPTEHQAMLNHNMDDDLGGNLGPWWTQYRKTLPGECQ